MFTRIKIHPLLILLIGMAIVASACAPSIKRPEEVGVGIQELMNCLPETPPETVVARGRFSISWRGISGGGYDGVLFYMRPNKLRITLYAPFGITLYEVLINRDGLYMIFPSEGVIKHREMGLSDLFISRRLFGRGDYTLRSDDRGYLMERPGTKSQNEWVERHLFDPSTLCLKESWFKISEGDEISVREEGFHEGVPEKIIISMKGYRLEMALFDITTGSILDETLFSIPQGYRMEPLEY